MAAQNQLQVCLKKHFGGPLNNGKVLSTKSAFRPKQPKEISLAIYNSFSGFRFFVL